jgi:peroxiredoxin
MLAGMPVDKGDLAPDFVLRDQNNQEVKLSSYRGSRSVLLVFYPFAFTGTCQGELSQVKAHLDALQNDAVQVLTVSVDSPYAHKVWADREAFTFPLLSDFWPHGAVADAYGVFNPKGGFALRGTFLVDTAGIVRFAELNGAGEPRDPSTWLAAIAQLQMG